MPNLNKPTSESERATGAVKGEARVRNAAATGKVRSVKAERGPLRKIVLRELRPSLGMVDILECGHWIQTWLVTNVKRRCKDCRETEPTSEDFPNE